MRFPHQPGTRVTKNDQPIVVVFCDHLLYSSETFIRAQVQALRRFAPVYAGSRRVPGLDLPEQTTYTINRGGVGGWIREARFKIFGSAPDLMQRLRVLEPVLMHSHFGPDGLRALPLARKLGLPLVVTFHGSDATATDVRHVRAPYGHRRYLARRKVLRDGATLFLAVSQFIRKKLLEQGFPAEKVAVHYIGIDTTLFSPRKFEDPNESIVLFVGRLHERKGVEFLIRAMAEVQKENPAAELVLIGDGPLRGALERQAKDSLQRVKFLGARTAEVVREWLDRASVFSAPSVKTASGEEEAFGMVFAEAQAMAKPVVSFRSGGIAEAVQHGETGLLSEERDCRALAQNLSLLLKNAGLRRQFGMAGRERVLRLFDLNAQTSKLETIYEEVLKAVTKGVQNPTSNFLQQVL
jgi:glycosyltransferase involved in cell wall biosynthesis